jgi:hypothetical protein
MPSVLVLVDSVPAADPANPESPPPPEFGLVLDLACAVAAASGGNVRVLSVIEAPPDESLSTSALDAQVRRKTIAAWNRAWADAYRAGLAADETLEPGRDPLPDIQPVVSVAIAGNYWTEVADAAQAELAAPPGDRRPQQDQVVALGLLHDHFGHRAAHRPDLLGVLGQARLAEQGGEGPLFAGALALRHVLLQHVQQAQFPFALDPECAGNAQGQAGVRSAARR